VKNQGVIHSINGQEKIREMRGAFLH